MRGLEEVERLQSEEIWEGILMQEGKGEREDEVELEVLEERR